ncbi:MAG: DNA/RNA nuclease SfsA [Oscillospiraceae bacterium]|nr:DNA/RNA nuclease SfsA [Oscillospiraceae bacterium]
MRYSRAVPAVFLDRPNRFIARVELNGAPETVHVKNTGRLRELLRPGAEVFLCPGTGAARKTRYDLIAVRKGDQIVNVDSQAPNAAAAELLRRLFPGWALFPERVCGDSRFDFCLERGEQKTYVEVKGVTLERNGTALFPDAPTERGVKHLRGLMAAKAAGHGACALFLLQMRGCARFSPNEDTDPAFAAALRQAQDAGVEILCYDCDVTPGSMTVRDPVALAL